jgi:cold shock CspA family protein
MQKLKWFDDGENYGFIVYKDNGNVVIRYSTNGNEYVEFELVKTDNGYKIKNKASTEEVA